MMEHFEKQLTAIIIFAMSAFISSSSGQFTWFFNTGLIFTPKVFIQCKNVNFDVPSQSFTVILFIAFEF